MRVKTTPVSKAIASLGGAATVARLRGLSGWAVSKWLRDGIPSGHVLWVAEQTEWRWTPHQLKPEIYPHPDDGMPVSHRGGEAA